MLNTHYTHNAYTIHNWMCALFVLRNRCLYCVCCVCVCAVCLMHVSMCRLCIVCVVYVQCV